MRIPVETLVSALSRGGFIRTFWRAPASGAGKAIARIPDGYVLIAADGRSETLLTHTDFLSVADQLTEAETWEQVVGIALFGGSTWRLRDAAPGSDTPEGD